VIVAPSREWSTRPNEWLGNELSYDNIMYAYHWYGDWGAQELSTIRQAAQTLPIFASEWGAWRLSGGGIEYDAADDMVDLWSELGISWTSWAWCDYDATEYALVPGTCPNGDFTNSITNYGVNMKRWLNNPADDFGTSVPCTDYCCPTGNACSNPVPGSCTSGRCCATASDCAPIVPACSGYCCPTGNTCSNPISGSCASGTCCADVYDCSSPVQTCTDLGNYCCPYICTQPASGSGCPSGNTCCDSESFCTQGSGSGDTRIARWKGDKEAAFSIHFDDSMYSQSVNALPALIERDIVGTWYINPGDPATYQRNVEAWENAPLVGQELADHTMTHTGADTYSEADYEIGETARIIWDLNPANKSRLLSFCWPGATSWGISDQERQQLLDQYNLIHRENMDFPPDYSPAGVMNQRADNALATGEWGGIAFHGIGGEWLAQHTEDFVEFADYLVTLKPRMWFGGNIAVHKYIEERDTANLQVLESTNSRIRISLTSAMDSALYDEPLTLITEVPWPNAQISHDGRLWARSAVNGEIMYNVRPDRGQIVLAPAGDGPYCGDGVCEGGEMCDVCVDDCGACSVECVHEADEEPCDGVVSITELITYINRWIDGDVTLQDVVGAIVEWKG